MMTFFRNQSLGARLIIAIAGTSLLVLIIAAIILAPIEMEKFKNNRLFSGRVIMDAYTVQFIQMIQLNTAEQAVNMSSQLSGFTELLSLIVNDVDGQRIFTYTSENPDATDNLFNLHPFVIDQPLRYLNKEYGNVNLTLSAKGYENAIVPYLTVGFSLIIGLFLLALLFARQLKHSIGDPIIELADVLEHSELDDTHSLKIGSNLPPEIKVLYERFNQYIITNANNQNALREQKHALDVSAIVSILDTSGKITYANELFYQSIGFQEDEIIGKEYWVLKSGHHDDAFFADLWQSITSGKIWRGEICNRGKNGTLHWHNTTIVPFYNADKLYQFLAICFDVTEQKTLEQTLISTRKKAEYANQAKSEFLANMSHEIRTPLNGVIGMIELVMDTHLEEKQKSYLKTANESAGLLLNVINDVLDFSKIEAKLLVLDVQVFELRDCVENIVSTLALRAHEKNIELICSIASNLPETVSGDNFRLQQIIINLIGNAIKFTEKGEVVLNVVLEENYGQLNQGDTFGLHFSIRDTGIGIEDKKQQKIFEAFSQSNISTTRIYGGTGLGLTISSQLVHLMRGKIWVESEAGKGSTFHFTAKMVVEKEVNIKKTRLIEQVKGTKVLVVDDNATNRFVLFEILSNWGMKPYAVNSASAALEALQQDDESDSLFKFIISDYQMPDMSGLDLARDVRKDDKWKNIPIIILSSVNSGLVQEKYETKNLVDGFLEKPVRQSVLLDKIRSIIGFSHDEISVREDTHIDKVNPAIRVLLAEDNLVNQEVVTGLLKKQGITQITIASNGKQALSAYQENDFDIILMDVRMPEMNGFQATEAIREIERSTQCKRTSIIALTAHAMKADRDECLSRGMDFYTTKPLKPDELYKILATISPAPYPDIKEIKEQSSDDIGDQNIVFNLDDALAPVGGDIEILHKVIKVFFDTKDELLENVRQAILSGDTNSIRDTAHTIKGSLSYLGAHQATDIALILERMGEKNTIHGCVDILEKLEFEVAKLVEALQQFQQEGES